MFLLFLKSIFEFGFGVSILWCIVNLRFWFLAFFIIIWILNFWITFLIWFLNLYITLRYWLSWIFMGKILKWFILDLLLFGNLIIAFRRCIFISIQAIMALNRVLAFIIFHLILCNNWKFVPFKNALLFVIIS